MSNPFKNSGVGTKRRYLLVTLYLWFILAASVVMTFMTLAHITDLQARNGSLPVWVIPVVGVLSLVNPTCVVALLCWKKWGFWGLVGQALLMAMIDLYRRASLEAAFAPFFGCLILYLILQAGAEKRAWPQLD